MKKIIAAAAALLLCGTVLTACKPEAKTDTPAETSAAETVKAVMVTEAETTTAAETTTTEATTTEAETETEAAAAVSYASLEEFAAAEPFRILTGEPSSNADSKFAKFTEDLLKDEKLYMDMKASDGSVSMVMAFEMPLNVYISISGKMPESGNEEVNMTIMLADETIYILDDTEKAGMYFAAPEDGDGLDGLGVSDSFSSILDIKDSDANSYKTCVVEIDGKSYTFEFTEDMGFLFDGDRLYAIVGEKDGSLPTNAFIINELSTNVPSGIFKVPSDYELTDMSALFASMAE